MIIYFQKPLNDNRLRSFAAAVMAGNTNTVAAILAGKYDLNSDHVRGELVAGIEKLFGQNYYWHALTTYQFKNQVRN